MLYFEQESMVYLFPQAPLIYLALSKQAITVRNLYPSSS